MRMPTIRVALKRGRLLFACDGCGKPHDHEDMGDGVYLPQCKPGTGYWRTGYFLAADRMAERRKK